MYVKVALVGPFLDPLEYEYKLKEPLELGARVNVKLRNTSRLGVVVAKDIIPNSPLDKIKPIEKLLDKTPIFSAQDLEFLRWAAAYYHAPLGDMLMTALPKKLRVGGSEEAKGEAGFKLTQLGSEQNLDSLPKRATKQQELLDIFLSQPIWTVSELNKKLDNWRASAKRFVEQGWLEETTQPCWTKQEFGTKPQHQLNSEQLQAVASISQNLDSFKSFLLEGITGSGKTEVYLAVIEKVLAQGKQALVLVPEIGLTPQTVARFEAYLQQPVIALHSAMTDNQRHCAWHLIKTGQVGVVLGTRSALFAQFKSLGICVIDEEHDQSFKQQDGVRYSARDLLIRRAHLLDIPVILGSATPSLETLHNALQGRYQLIQLTQRAAAASLPKMSLLDIRGQRLQEGISNQLKAAMQRHLEAGNQVLLFLNRRGFAPILMCHTCGWQAQCSQCDANLTLHSRWQEVRCHHCGFSARAPRECPKCKATEFVQLGQGTERLEQLIAESFPEQKILRIDRDTTRAKGALEEKVEQARTGEANILIGTQMLAKGHHFPQVTLVGIVDLDQGLFSLDYRAPEKMAQLVIQVAGRAGREVKQGEVLIQTHHPEHPLLQRLVRQGYRAFAEEALAEREVANLPPFSYQILMRAEAVQGQLALDFLAEVKNLLLQVSVSEPCEVWGPVVAPMELRQGRYRYQLLLQSQSRKVLHDWLAKVDLAIYKLPLASRVRWSLDVDPQDFY